MKTLFTSLLAITFLLAINAQEDIIRNGDFELNDGSGTIAGLDNWHIDKDSPGSGYGGDPGSLYVFLSGDDSATVYQVVDVVSADSMIYELTFWAKNSWIAEKIAVTASTSDADTTIRTIYKTDSITLTDEGANLSFQFAFSPGSALVGKKLIVEFSCYDLESWAHIATVKLIRKLPGENSQPIAEAGVDQKVTGGDLVTLDGSASSDSDGDPLTYLWSSQYPGIILSDPTAVQPTFTAPDVKEISIYNFSLSVNDGTTNSDTSYTSVTVIPAGELIRNGDFTMREESWETTNSLKDIKYWNIDEEMINLNGGIWDMEMIHLMTQDPSLYQVVDVVSSDTTIYTLTFSSKTSWYCTSINSIFSVSDADTSVRTELNMQENLYEIDPATGIESSDWVVYKHVYMIPSNSAHVGKKLMLEFKPTPYNYEDIIDDGWAQLEFVSLVKETLGVGTSVKTNASDKLTLYPNPTTSTLNINSESPVLELTIYSLTGKIVKWVVQNEINTVDVHDLSSGLYLIKLTTHEGIISKKLQIR